MQWKCKINSKTTSSTVTENNCIKILKSTILFCKYKKYKINSKTTLLQKFITIKTLNYRILTLINLNNKNKCIITALRFVHLKYIMAICKYNGNIKLTLKQLFNKKNYHYQNPKFNKLIFRVGYILINKELKDKYIKI